MATSPDVVSLLATSSSDGDVVDGDVSGERCAPDTDKRQLKRKTRTELHS